MTLESNVLAWDRHKHVAGITDKWYPNTLPTIGSPVATQKRLKKPAQIRFHSKRQHAITEMNDSINMNSGQYTSRVNWCL